MDEYSVRHIIGVNIETIRVNLVSKLKCQTKISLTSRRRNANHFCTSYSCLWCNYTYHGGITYTYALVCYPLEQNQTYIGVLRGTDVRACLNKL